MSNEITAKRESKYALKCPVGSFFEPNFCEGTLRPDAEIIHIDCIKIVPHDRDPIVAKVFLVLFKEQEKPVKRSARISAFGFEVKGLKPTRTADVTTKDKLFENLHYAQVGLAKYGIATTAEKK